MPTPTQKITEREKVAIFAYCYGLIPDLTTAFLIAENRAVEEAQGLVALKSAVSRWVHSDKFKREAEHAKRLIYEHEQNAIQRGKDEAKQEQRQEEERPAGSERQTNTKPAKIAPVDYSNPKARRDLYNKIIHDASDDPKTQLDAAKLIEQTQREDKQAAQDNKIQRFYTPVNCKSCPLYVEALKKHERKP